MEAGQQAIHEAVDWLDAGRLRMAFDADSQRHNKFGIGAMVLLQSRITIKNSIMVNSMTTLEI